MPALLIIRAEPAPADRDAFDRDHDAAPPPEAVKGSPPSARRG